jgi:tetratricopeptide (TPR) repeat protein
MKVLPIWMGLLLVHVLPGAAFGLNLAGEWSYQALNSGDTSFKAEQEGNEITFYRVLHPEFEGKAYQLEHLYRGQVKGKGIEGKLMVREEGMKSFEFLRPFTGKILDETRLIVDDLPLRREKLSQTADAPAAQEEEPAVKYTKVVINRKQGEGSNQEAASKAPSAIPSLLPVAGEMQTESGRAADKALMEGDKNFEAKRYDGAVLKYQDALSLNPQKMEALYKLGLSHGILGSKMSKAGKIEGAAEHYKKAIEFWTQVVRYDPYNNGAKENVKRAKQKLVELHMQ